MVAAAAALCNVAIFLSRNFSILIIALWIVGDRPRIQEFSTTSLSDPRNASCKRVSTEWIGSRKIRAEGIAKGVAFDAINACNIDPQTSAAGTQSRVRVNDIISDFVSLGAIDSLPAAHEKISFEKNLFSFASDVFSGLSTRGSEICWRRRCRRMRPPGTNYNTGCWPVVAIGTFRLAIEKRRSNRLPQCAVRA